MKELIMAVVLLVNTAATGIDKRIIDVELSAYCPCCLCSEGWGNKSASGKSLKEGHIAAPKELEFGTKVKIKNKTYEVVDRGGYIRKVDNVYRLDIFMSQHSECIKFGRRRGKAFIIER